MNSRHAQVKAKTMQYSPQDAKMSSQPLVMHRSDPNELEDTGHLFKEGLALADRLDRMRPAEVLAIALHSPDYADELFPRASDCFAESMEDITAVQSITVVKLPLSAKGTFVQTDADRSWTQVWLQRGFVKLKQQNFEGAADNFKRVLKKEADSIEALNALSVAQYHLAKYPEAAESLRKAILLRPNQSTLYCNLGAVLYAYPDFESAVAAFGKAARLDPKDVIAYYGMGLSLIQQQDYSRAIAAFQRAVNLNDQYANSYYGLGYAHFQQGDLPAAIAAIGKAKQRNPEYAKRYETFLKHCLEQDKKPRQLKR
jgi:tetratricopeptide (TPR) repeat protein